MAFFPARDGWVRSVRDLPLEARRLLLELLYPECCVLCSADPTEAPWPEPGMLVPGLAAGDGPHLCLACVTALGPDVRWGRLPGLAVPVCAGRPTGPALVTVLTQWKYHGVRGLAWGLAPLLSAALREIRVRHGPWCGVVPVPLHPSRRRARGFNQAEVLVRLALAGEPGQGSMSHGLLRRVRPTAQQAQLAAGRARADNVAGSFAAVGGPTAGQDPRLVLVDDLVTGGTTCAAAAAALQRRGWRVVGVAALGLAEAGGPERPGAS